MLAGWAERNTSRIRSNARSAKAGRGASAPSVTVIGGHSNGSEAEGKAAAIAYTLANGVDPAAWFTRIPDQNLTKSDELMPWHWNG
jgi:hypothetical protein